MRRRFYKNWYKAKKKAFSKYSAGEGGYAAKSAATAEQLKKHATVVRVLAHTNVRAVGIGQKKAHLAEVQVNGGTVEEKVDFALSLFEQPVGIDAVFSQDEMIDVIGVTKGHGFNGKIFVLFLLALISVVDPDSN